jgi:hypothetical protein
MRLFRQLNRWRLAVCAALVTCSLAVLSLTILLCDHLALQPPSDLPPDFDLRHGVAFGVASHDDFRGAYYTYPPGFRYCLQGDGSWTIIFHWTLISKGELPPGVMLLSVPSDASRIQHVAPDTFRIKGTSRESRGSRAPTLLHVVLDGDRKVIRYRSGELLKADGYAFAPFIVLFHLPSTRTRKLGLGQWEFRIPYLGRLGDLGHQLPSMVGASRYRVPSKRSGEFYGPWSDPNSPPLEDPQVVELSLCTRDQPYKLRSSHPTPLDSGLETYSWRTRIDQDTSIEGNFIGGLGHTLRQVAPEILVGSIWALIGALFGMALEVRRGDRPAIASSRGMGRSAEMRRGKKRKTP